MSIHSIKACLWVLLILFIIAYSPACLSGQKNHYKKNKPHHADTTGMTAEQKKIMLQRTLEEKMHYYYKDSARINKK